MIKKETGIAAVSLGVLLINQCVEKDYFLKPAFCAVFSGITTYYTGKATYQAASATYDQYVKPTLKAFLANPKLQKGK